MTFSADKKGLGDLFCVTEGTGKGLVDSNLITAVAFDEHFGPADGSLKASLATVNVHCRERLGKVQSEEGVGCSVRTI